MQFFRLMDDINFPSRWHLGGLIGVDGREFVRPPMIPLNDPLRDQVYNVEVQVAGRAMDYTTTSFRSVPVASFKVVQAISGLDGFTAFPARIVGFPQETSYHILHFWDEVECVDEERSRFEKYEVDDPVRPDLAGHYRGFFKLIIDPQRAANKHIFKLAKSGPQVVVSEEVKRRFEAAGVTGAVFESVVPI